jgi:hypothetical protein
MAWYADLEPYPFRGETTNKLLAVGWLESKYAFPCSRQARAVIDQFAECVWTQGRHFPFGYLGFHSCSFCGDQSEENWVREHNGRWSYVGFEQSTDIYNGITTIMGAANIFIPGKTAVYIAPSLMLHYLDSHDYAPPSEFIDALAQCPPIGCEAYYQALEPVAPAWMRRWIEYRGNKPRNTTLAATTETATVQIATGKVYPKGVEFKTDRAALCVSEKDMHTLADFFEAIVRDMCQHISQLLYIIISIKCLPGHMATASLAHISTGEMVLGTELSRRLGFIRLPMDVSQPCHFRLHYGVTPHYSH